MPGRLSGQRSARPDIASEVDGGVFLLFLVYNPMMMTLSADDIVEIRKSQQSSPSLSLGCLDNDDKTTGDKRLSNILI